MEYDLNATNELSMLARFLALRTGRLNLESD